MLKSYQKTSQGIFILTLLAVFIFPARPLPAQPLRVCATVPELGSLFREIGGDQVMVTVFAKGTEDAHFVEAKPSFIKALNACDVYGQIGLELEVGWAPVLLREARNAKVLTGAAGYLNAADVITPLDAPTAPVDRSMGDVHPFGNPHFLLDPLNGLKVAAFIRDRLREIRSDVAPYFSDRYDQFRQRLGNALVGNFLAQKYEFEKLALLFARGKLNEFLQSQGEASHLGGWLAAMAPYHNVKVIVDHNLWPYFLERFGLQLAGTLEPKPGIPPTTAHLQKVIDIIKTNDIKVVLTTAYYDPRYAEFVSENTGATVVNMAHQAGARPGTDEYIAWMDYNIRQLTVALGHDA